MGNPFQQRFKIGPLEKPVAVDWIAVHWHLAIASPVAEGICRYCQKRCGVLDCQIGVEFFHETNSFFDSACQQGTNLTKVYVKRPEGDGYARGQVTGTDGTDR